MKGTDLLVELRQRCSEEMEQSRCQSQIEEKIASLEHPSYGRFMQSKRIEQSEKM